MTELSPSATGGLDVIDGLSAPSPEGRERGGRVGARAYKELRRRILRRDLPAGTVLAEAELAKTLGMSRTPVRQALHLLLQEGLVEVGPRRQMIVCRISAERRREIFLVREALERLAVAEACQVMPLEEIDHLRLLLWRQRRAADAGRPDEFIRLDEQFHLDIASGAKLEVLLRFHAQLRAFVRLMGIEAVRSHPARMAEVISEHELVVDALERRDEVAAVTALCDHLRATEAVLAGSGVPP